MNYWKEPRFVPSRGRRTLAISNAPAYLHSSRITNTFLPELLIPVKYILLQALIIQGNFRFPRAFAHLRNLPHLAAESPANIGSELLTY